MAKSTPSVLWYPADYLVGVIGMTWEEQGRYTYLLNLQQQRGHLNLDAIMPDCPEIVKDKFLIDDDGLYYNQRMDEEMEKRYKYVQSRKNNLSHKGSHKEQHTESRMDNDNIYINKTNNTNLSNNPLPPSSSPSKDAEPKDAMTIHGETIREVVRHLNEVMGTRYRPNAALTVRKIVARLNEGYTLNDFIAVIDKKAKDWKGTEYEKFIRPETLFGSKFEGYLNQPKDPEDEAHDKAIRNRVFNLMFNGRSWALLDPEEQSVVTKDLYEWGLMQEPEYLLAHRQSIIERFGG